MFMKCIYVRFIEGVGWWFLRKNLSFIFGFWFIKILIYFCIKKWLLYRDIRNFFFFIIVKFGIEKVIKVKWECCML